MRGAEDARQHGVEEVDPGAVGRHAVEGEDHDGRVGGDRREQPSDGLIAGDVELAEAAVEHPARRFGDRALDARAVPEPVPAAVQRAEDDDREIERPPQQPEDDLAGAPDVVQQVLAQPEQLRERLRAVGLGADRPFAEPPPDLREQIARMARWRRQGIVARPAADFEAPAICAAEGHRDIISDHANVRRKRPPEGRGGQPLRARARVSHGFVPPLVVVVDPVLRRRLPCVEGRPR